MPANKKGKAGNVNTRKKAKAKTSVVRNKTTVSVLAYNTKSKNKGAKLSSNNGVTRVSHREVVSEAVICNSAFGVTHTIAVQPAISTYSHGSPLGNWLPKIASEYDHYQFEMLKLHYVPTCATTQAGLVVLSCDPNPEGSPPDSFSNMKNMKDAVTGPARERLTLDVTSIVKKQLLTRDAAVQSFPLYDAGRLFVASMAGTDVSVGYIEVEYVVRLSNPQTGPRTEIGNNIAVVYPATTYNGNALSGAPGTQRWFGTTHVQRNAGAWMYDCITNASSIGGYGVDAPITLSSGRTTALTFVHPNSGVTYSMPIGYTMPYWNFTKAGRYKFSARLPGDWQNYAMFGCDLVSWGPASGAGSINAATSLPVAATDVLRNSVGAIGKTACSYTGWRGLRSTVTGGTDDDDFVPEVDITFAVDAGERISFLVGVRNDSNVAENGDAWVLYDTRSGLPQHKLEYLGAVSN